MTETQKTHTLAHSHVLRLQRQLEGDGYAGGEWESHRRLLDAAHNSTNGGSGDIRVLSENIGMLSAFVVQRDIQSREEHDSACPVKRLVTRGPDGQEVMPWEQKKPGVPFFGSVLSYDFKTKTVYAGGLVAVLAIVGLVVLGYRALDSKLEGVAKVAAALQAKTEGEEGTP